VIPGSFEEDLAFLSSALNLVYSGIVAGQVMKGKLVPAHSLALSNLFSEDLPALHVDYEDAIRYLQRQEMKLSTDDKGWQLVQYDGHNLGWVNVLSNRINNYYPKELRILKQSNDASYGK
jgi:NOL1/NOP2/fmu family ribosome biogenesis protein